MLLRHCKAKFPPLLTLSLPTTSRAAACLSSDHTQRERKVILNYFAFFTKHQVTEEKLGAFICNPSVSDAPHICAYAQRRCRAMRGPHTRLGPVTRHSSQPPRHMVLVNSFHYCEFTHLKQSKMTGK